MFLPLASPTVCVAALWLATGAFSSPAAFLAPDHATTSATNSSTVPPTASGETRFYNLTLTPGWGAPDGVDRLIYLVNGRTPGPLIEASQGDMLDITVFNELPSAVAMHWHGLHQRGTPEYDGVPGVTQWAILPGGNFTYRFGTDTNYGPYWYHAHLRNYYQDGIRGPIMVHARSDVARPFDLISNTTYDIAAMMTADATPSTLMLMDWYHETGDAILARLAATNDSMQPLCADSILFNGIGAVQCPSVAEVAAMGLDSKGCMSSMAPMTMGHMPDTMTSATSGLMLSSSIATTTVPSASPTTSTSSASMSGSKSNTCTSNYAPLYTFGPSTNTSWFAINLINSAASQQFSFSIDSHDFWVFSADGRYVMPQRAQSLEIGIGQRYGIMIERANRSGQHVVRASTRTQQVYQGTAILDYSLTLNTTSSTMPAAPIFTMSSMGNPAASTSAMEMTTMPPSTMGAGETMTMVATGGMTMTSMDGSTVSDTAAPWIALNGTSLNGGMALNDTLIAPYPPAPPPPSTRLDHFKVNQTSPTEWELDGVTFSSEAPSFVPLLFEPRILPGVHNLTKGTVIDIVLQVATGTLDAMAHPIHLHGHYFWVLGSMANSTFPVNATIAEAQQAGVALNVEDPVQRDTAHLPEGGWLALRFQADNPGAWLMHCHINAHLASGMAVVFIESQDEIPAFAAALTLPPRIA